MHVLIRPRVSPNTSIVSAKTSRTEAVTIFYEIVYMYYPGQKNRYSRDIHEIDPQCDHVISRDIDFDLQPELATRSYRESRRCRTEARYRTISHDRTVDQPHEFLGCNDFFGQGSISLDRLHNDVMHVRQSTLPNHS